MWRQVRWLAGAVMCETRDLGIKWPQCVRVDMRYVCPKDVKKMLVQQARSAYWKKRAAKHGYEKLKEGIWLGSGYVANEKRRKSGLRSIGMLRGSYWVQKRLLDIGWSDESAKPATRRKAQKSTGSTTPQNGTSSIWEISKAFRKWEQKARTSMEWKWHGGIVTHPLSESQRSRGHFSMIKWESEKHKSCGIPKDFKGH